MANPLFSRFGQNASNIPASQGPMNNGFFGLFNRFQQFKAAFKGDPRAQVQQLLESGQMTQEQFNQLSQMASQFQSI